MRDTLKKCSFFTGMVFFLAIVLIQPVAAANDTVTIGYSGTGGSYIGDMIFFSGMDTASNTILMKIAGPGLPAEGVPVYNLTGEPGTGTSIEVDKDGIWKFLWYISSTAGVDKLQTARYTIAVQDLNRPNLSATTSVFLKRPEFYGAATPNPAGYGDYVMITGNAERGVDYVRIDVVDGTGTSVRTFMAPVGADGYFNYGFHADIPPGSYVIKVSNPSMKSMLRVNIAILPPESANVTANMTTTEVTSSETAIPVATSSPSTTRNRLPLPPVLALCGIIAGAFMIARVRQGRK